MGKVTGFYKSLKEPTTDFRYALDTIREYVGLKFHTVWEGLHVESYDQFDECDREKYDLFIKCREEGLKNTMKTVLTEIVWTAGVKLIKK